MSFSLLLESRIRVNLGMAGDLGYCCTFFGYMSLSALAATFSFLSCLVCLSVRLSLSLIILLSYSGVGVGTGFP